MTVVGWGRCTDGRCLLRIRSSPGWRVTRGRSVRFRGTIGVGWRSPTLDRSAIEDRSTRGGGSATPDRSAWSRGSARRRMDGPKGAGDQRSDVAGEDRSRWGGGSPRVGRSAIEDRSTQGGGSATPDRSAWSRGSARRRMDGAEGAGDRRSGVAGEDRSRWGGGVLVPIRGESAQHGSTTGAHGQEQIGSPVQQPAGQRGGLHHARWRVVDGGGPG